MSHVYCGIRCVNGATVTRDGQPFDHGPSLRVWNHSPTGFEWGYGGSGPAQLALAILLDYCNPDEAVQRHQAFKWAVVCDLDSHNFVLYGEDVAAWLAVQRDCDDVRAHLSNQEQSDAKGGA